MWDLRHAAFDVSPDRPSHRGHVHTHLYAHAYRVLRLCICTLLRSCGSCHAHPDDRETSDTSERAKSRAKQQPGAGSGPVTLVMCCEPAFSLAGDCAIRPSVLAPPQRHPLTPGFLAPASFPLSPRSHPDPQVSPRPIMRINEVSLLPRQPRPARMSPRVPHASTPEAIFHDDYRRTRSSCPPACPYEGEDAYASASLLPLHLHACAEKCSGIVQSIWYIWLHSTYDFWAAQLGLPRQPGFRP